MLREQEDSRDFIDAVEGLDKSRDEMTARRSGDAVLRTYGVGAQILVDLGVKKMRLMTNNPTKFGGLDGYDFEIVGREPLLIEPNSENIAYLRTKRERMGHELGDLGGDGGVAPVKPIDDAAGDA